MNNSMQEKVDIGSSARRQLVLRTPEQVALLNFAADGPYTARVVLGETEQPQGQPALTGSGWLRIYDDEELTFLAQADRIRVYADGANACLVLLDGHAHVEKMVTLQQMTRRLQQLVDQAEAQK